jgi:Flp pilus assembly protein TadG
VRRVVERGQALTEFALILPVLLLLLFGLLDFGRAIYAYNALANAAREGGRTAIINQSLPAVRQKAAQQATALGLSTSDPGDCPAAGGATATAGGTCVVFRTADLSGTCTTVTIGCNALVSVKWEFRAITPVIGTIIGPLDIVADTTQTVESVCPRPDGPATCPER